MKGKKLVIWEMMSELLKAAKIVLPRKRFESSSHIKQVRNLR